MYAARDGADEIRHGYTGVDECESRSIYAGLKAATVLLEDLDVDVDLRARVEVCADYGFECRFYRCSEFQYSSVKRRSARSPRLVGLRQ